MKKVLFISIIVLLGTGLFSGCKNDKDQTYLYAIGIDGYAYDGSTLLGPMLYLESLGIAKSLSIVSTDQQDADKQAIVRFDAEMGKIDAATLASYGNTVYVRYVLQTLGEEQTTLQEKEFGKNRDVFYCGSSARKIKMLLDFPCQNSCNYFILQTIAFF